MNDDRPLGQHRRISVVQITPGRYQTRFSFDNDSLEELAESIDAKGVIQPIVVRSISNSRYEIIAGERRWRATKLVGLDMIDCIVRDDLSEVDAAIFCIAENLQRESLSPIEEAKSYQRLCLEFHMEHQDVATQIGKSRSYVTNYIRLLDIDSTIQKYVHDGILSVGHARAIAALPSSMQLSFGDMCLRLHWNVRQLEKKVKEYKELIRKDPNAEAKVGRHPDIIRLEGIISKATCSPVSLEFDETTRKGFLRFEYYSLDEVKGLVDRFVGPDWEDVD